jgi:putative flippase GtrA
MNDTESAGNSADRGIDLHDRDTPSRRIGTAIGRATLVRRYIKFCTVGLTSTAIYFAVSEGTGRLFSINLGTLLGLNAVLPAAFLISAFNGYVWNRLWTFRSTDPRRGRQFTKFATVSGIGMALNSGITSIGWLVLSRQGVGNPWRRWIAMGIAIVIVSVWNFSMNQFWTFRHRDAET